MSSQFPRITAETSPVNTTAAAKVVAIVLNWNLAAETLTCVERLLDSDYPNLQIIVVDNGSTDSSVDSLRERLPHVQLLALPENRGYAAGNNAGIVQALALGAEWILLVNNDATLARDAISTLVAVAGPTAGLAMPRIDALPTGKLWRAGSRVRGIYPLPRPVSSQELAAGPCIPVDYVVGCVLLIRRSVLETIGLLDERYFMYYEDLDFSARARTSGFEVVVIPGARAWHQIGASLKKDQARRTYLQTRYRTLWCRSQALSVTAIAWWLALGVGSVQGLVSAAGRGDWARVQAIARGLWNGMGDSGKNARAGRPV